MEDQTITLLYTANLKGDLYSLPKLYTYLRVLRGEFHPVYLLDLGASCSAESWHCDITEGRSMLIALDGMGYTAANAAHLSRDSREKLLEQTTMALVDETHPHVEAALRFAITPVDDDSSLCILLTPYEQTVVKDNHLYLQTVEAGQVGIVTLKNGELFSTETRIVPSDTAPDGTIAGVVDFILAEARYYQRRKRENL
jgi:hypothetical protein